MKVSLRPGTKYGKGVFADEFIPMNTLVFSAQRRYPTEQLFYHVNHSCRPSCYLEGEDVFSGYDIEPDDELTIFYPDISFPVELEEFDCTCGNEECIGRVKIGSK